MSKFILPLVIVTFFFVCVQTQAFKFYEPVVVHIVSRVPNNPGPLRCRCQSKDDDFGIHTLSNGQEFYWKFSPNIIQSTLYFCHFYWDSKDKSFVVYDKHTYPLYEPDKDNNYYWEVRTDGFYLAKDDKVFTKKNDWA